jgi:hypothetical protein
MEAERQHVDPIRRRARIHGKGRVLLDNVLEAADLVAVFWFLSWFHSQAGCIQEGLTLPGHPLARLINHSAPGDRPFGAANVSRCLALWAPAPIHSEGGGRRQGRRMGGVTTQKLVTRWDRQDVARVCRTWVIRRRSSQLQRTVEIGHKTSGT